MADRSPYLSDGTWGWVSEQHRWFYPHIMLPFLAYFYVGRLDTILLVVYLWESIELLVKSEMGDYAIYLGNTTNESIQDSFIGDPFNGFVGVLAAMWFCWVFKYKPRSSWSSIRPFVARGLQFLSLAVHTLWLRYYVGTIPVGFLVMLLGFPIQTYLFFGWNGWPYGGYVSAYVLFGGLAFLEPINQTYAPQGWGAIVVLSALAWVVARRHRRHRQPSNRLKFSPLRV